MHFDLICAQFGAVRSRRRRNFSRARRAGRDGSCCAASRGRGRGVCHLARAPPGDDARAPCPPALSSRQFPLPPALPLFVRVQLACNRSGAGIFSRARARAGRGRECCVVLARPRRRHSAHTRRRRACVLPTCPQLAPVSPSPTRLPIRRRHARHARAPRRRQQCGE